MRLTTAAAAAAAAYTPPPPHLSKEGLHLLHGTQLTLIGFGSLLSETSSRTTFPHLTNFRLGRVTGYRRLFRHPAAIFFERGIAHRDTLEFSSLSVEHVPVSSSSDDEGEELKEHGFVCSLFDVPEFNVHDYVSREEEFAFVMADYLELGVGEAGGNGNGNRNGHGKKKEQGQGQGQGKGLMCVATTDSHVEERWGEGYIDKKYRIHGLDNIWDEWPERGILPCPIYLRHCVLAAQKQGEEAHRSFLQETYLSDRKTTIEEYLAMRPDIMLMEPPPSVIGRYSG